MVSTTCAFCDSPLVETDTGSSIPFERVVRFVVPRKGASDGIHRALAERWFVPKALREGEIAELKPVYVPTYAWRGKVRSAWSASCGIVWYRTETYTTTDSQGKTVTRTRQVREVDWHPCDGTHAYVLDGHLVSASVGLPESESNALEPYDLGEAVPFAPEHLAGVTTERPTVDVVAGAEVARAEILQLTHQTITGFVPGDEVRQLQVDADIDLHGVDLVLLPTWIAALRGEGEEVVRLLVNGQTGEVIADAVPRDWGAVARLVAVGVGVFLVLGLLGALVSALAGGAP